MSQPILSDHSTEVLHVQSEQASDKAVCRDALRHTATVVLEVIRCMGRYGITHPHLCIPGEDAWAWCSVSAALIQSQAEALQVKPLLYGGLPLRRCILRK